MLALVWHFWIGLLLLIGSLATLAAVGVGYLARVSSMKYPKGGGSPGRR